MSTPKLRFGLLIDSFEVSADVPLTPLLGWFEKLQERNEEARRRDQLHVSQIAVRVRCPNCDAGMIHLTSVSEDGALRRACRLCHHRFDLEE
jgi:hypothetical protein